MSDYSEIGARFTRDTASHEMTVLHEDGLYRHLRFMAPAPASNCFWFDLITWPGCLTIRGDLGNSFTFARIPDMFEFFRGKRINPHYWAEKLDAGRASAQMYSEEVFRETVWSRVREEVAEYRGLAKAVQEHFFGEMAEWNVEFEEEARSALEAFEFLPDGRKGESFRFDDTWEWSLKDYDWVFIWACHAIIWGIRQYDAAKAEAEARRVRPAVRDLVKLIAAREGASSPCWIMRTHNNCALIAPTAKGELQYLRSFKRRTVDEAQRLGLVSFGSERQPVPSFTGAPNWLVEVGGDLQGEMVLEGRTITATGGAS